MKTYYGTYTDIMESDIIAVYGNYRFYFTSNYNKNKFIENVEYYVHLEELKFTTKYHINIHLKNYFSICYYMKVQKRGFRVEQLDTGKRLRDIDFNITLVR